MARSAPSRPFTRARLATRTFSRKYGRRARKVGVLVVPYCFKPCRCQQPRWQTTIYLSQPIPYTTTARRSPHNHASLQPILTGAAVGIVDHFSLRPGIATLTRQKPGLMAWRGWRGAAPTLLRAVQSWRTQQRLMQIVRRQKLKLKQPRQLG